MGFYSTIEVDKLLLPAESKIHQLLKLRGETTFQTKDLGRDMALYKIEDRFLWRQEHDTFEDGEQTIKVLDTEYTLPNYRFENKRWEKAKHHGTIRFYDCIPTDDNSDDEWWVEYAAVFSQGKLIEITPVKEYQLDNSHLTVLRSKL
jgi:hypothetical protein